MAFVDQELPAPLSVGARRIDSEPGLQIVTTDGGFEVRNQRHAQSSLKWEIDLRPYRRDSATWAAVIDQFKATRGGLHVFPFSPCDPEHSALVDELIGTGDGARTEFQVTKTWTVGGQSQTRVVSRPVPALTVKKNGVTQVSGYSVDYATGLITFTPAVANGVVVSVSGAYRIPVRFDREMVATGLANHLEQFETLLLVEVKE